MNYIFRPSKIEAVELTGREMRFVITSESAQARNMSVVVIDVPPGSAVYPCHSHPAEEAIYVVAGHGEYWIDGQVGSFTQGDIVWFPYGSKHMIRNAGSKILQAVCIFSPPMDPSHYSKHEDITFTSEKRW